MENEFVMEEFLNEVKLTDDNYNKINNVIKSNKMPSNEDIIKSKKNASERIKEIQNDEPDINPKTKSAQKIIRTFINKEKKSATDPRFNDIEKYKKHMISSMKNASLKAAKNNELSKNL